MPVTVSPTCVYGSLRGYASIRDGALWASRWRCALPRRRRSSPAPGVHAEGAAAGAQSSLPYPTAGGWGVVGTRPAWVSRGISLVFQLSSRGSDVTVPKLQSNLAPRPSVSPRPSRTSRESPKPKQLQDIKIKIKAWAQSSSSASGWLCDLGPVPYPL